MRRRKVAAKVEVRSDKKDVLSLVDHGQVYFMNRHGLIKALWSIFGCFAMIYCGYRYSLYCGALNEAHLWFSNIKVCTRFATNDV